MTGQLASATKSQFCAHVTEKKVSAELFPDAGKERKEATVALADAAELISHAIAALPTSSVLSLLRPLGNCPVDLTFVYGASEKAQDATALPVQMVTEISKRSWEADPTDLIVLKRLFWIILECFGHKSFCQKKSRDSLREWKLIHGLTTPTSIYDYHLPLHASYNNYSSNGSNLDLLLVIRAFAKRNLQAADFDVAYFWIRKSSQNPPSYNSYKYLWLLSSSAWFK